MCIRCEWAGEDPLYVAYHDTEWGVPIHHDRKLFEFLILEGAQAGLSWITILKKRENYRRQFDQFDPEKIARYDEKKVERLLNEPGVIRNRLKLQGAVKNAQAFLSVLDHFGSFDSYIWRFTEGKPVINHFKNPSEIPAETPLSVTMGKELKQRGFTFVGPTICYAFMQATGMVNDHLIGCFRHADIQRLYVENGERS